MFGSYNKFNNKINIDAAVVSSLDFITSLIASCVIFSVLGFLSQEIGIPVEHVADGGQGCATDIPVTSIKIFYFCQQFQIMGQVICRAFFPLGPCFCCVSRSVIPVASTLALGCPILLHALLPRPRLGICAP